MDDDEIHVPINNDLERKIADVFDVFDHANNKSVDAREIGTIVRALGCVPTEAELQEMLVKMEDAENPGTIHLIMLIPLLTQSITEHKFEPATPGQLLEAFHVLDEQGIGYLTKEQITKVITQEGEQFSQDELDEMLEIAIDPQTQTVPYEYYINQLMHELEDYNVYDMADRVVRERQLLDKPKKISTMIFKDISDLL